MHSGGQADMTLLRRREFIAALGSATAWPFAARAQQSPMPVVGFLSGGSSAGFAPLVTAFRQGLREVGFVEGQNVVIEFRWAAGHYDRIPALAAELAGRRVAVIAATGGAYERDLGGKTAIGEIPLVFLTAGDPVKRGRVASLNRPGGSVTGVSFLISSLVPKRLELLRELVPNAAVVGMIVNPNNPDFETELKDAQTAAGTTGSQLLFLKAGDESEIATVFATMADQRVRAFLTNLDPLFLSEREQIITLASRYSIPAIYGLRNYVTVGGLMSYGTDVAEGYRQVGIYVGQILKGAKPADLPIVQAGKVELVLNLKTAKTLGITFPLSLLGRADEVIE
jgi:ABC-type uncharacterized transport system substrate-binding protein